MTRQNMTRCAAMGCDVAAGRRTPDPYKAFGAIARIISNRDSSITVKLTGVKKRTEETRTA